MIIVAGHLLVDPDHRTSYLEGCHEVVRLARATSGCLDFTLSADLLDPGRINVLERWESLAAVDAFRGSGPSEDQTAQILEADVRPFAVAPRGPGGPGTMCPCEENP
jgi:quinol monooxygenase YgiN